MTSENQNNRTRLTLGERLERRFRIRERAPSVRFYVIIPPLSRDDLNGAFTRNDVALMGK